jgi:predicted metalloprotease with PDZ domain
VADSSFDTWIKYYRQDENAPNAIVSYYQKGAIIGLALDLLIRQRSRGDHCLDDVMRALWQAHGRTGIGVAEGAIEKIAARVTGLNLDDFFAQAVYGTEDIALAPLLSHVGIEMKFRAPGQAKSNEPVPATLGIKSGKERNGEVRVLQVFDAGAAQAAGLAAGDHIIAIDGIRVTAADVDQRVRGYPVGSRIELVGFRRDELMHFSVTLQGQAKTSCTLSMQNTSAEARARREAWLSPQPFSSPAQPRAAANQEARPHR